MPATVRTVIPSAFRRRSDRSSAISSMTPALNASSAPMFRFSVTKRSAAVTFLPWILALSTKYSLMALTVLLSAGVAFPEGPRITGWQDPMTEPGAMAARCVLSSMMVPADQAAPEGGTKPMTGTGDPSIIPTMSMVASSCPPGVSRTRTRASAPSANSSAPCISSTVPGPMVPLTDTTTTL